MKTRFFNLPALVVSISLLALSGALKLAVSAHPLSALAPTVTSVSPNQGYNYQPTTITITGSDFVATPTAQLNNIPLTNVTFVDGATLTATVPADLPGGAYTIMVTNPDNQSGSLASAFMVLLSGDGSLGTWQATTPMTTVRDWPAAAQANNFLYIAGGGNPFWSNLTNSVERATISSNGALSEWQSMSSMNTPRAVHAAVTVGNYIYALGGYTSGGGQLTSVEFAVINGNGSLGTWQLTSSMITGRDGLGAVASSGFLYAIGGELGGGTKSVERAAINSDGSLGPWQAMSSMNTRRGYLAAVVVAGYIYAIGGQNYDSASLSSVERAAINSDGTLGNWQLVNSMNLPRCDLAAVAARSYIYAIGGSTCTGEMYNTVERARINVDGSIGPWEMAGSMTTKRFRLTAAQAGQYIYAIGGEDSTYAILTSIEMAAVNPPSLISFSPLAVASDQATTVTVNGTNILPTPTLHLGDSTTLTSSFVSTTTVSATIPSGLANGWYTATITSGDGRTATLTNALRVDGPGPVVVGDLGVTINDGALFTNQVTVTLTIGSITNTALMQVSNDGGFAGAPWETYTSHKTWQITQYGSYVLPRVVYVRYKDLNGNTSATSQDDIILDVTPPVGTVSIIGATGLQAMASTVASTVTLGLSATDDVSGVGQMLISNQPDFSGAIWESYATSRAWALGSNGTVYVRYRDNAGNVSTTYTATQTNTYRIFLPLVIRN